jgi:nucleoside-diphosphate-sugar epimerase
MAKVLVTGGSGFIGGFLTEMLLAQGDDVVCLVRKTSHVERLQTLGARLTSGDVTDPESLPAALSGIEIVYHVAGCIKALDRHAFHQVNCDGTVNVLRACSLQPQPPVTVLVSSLAAAGPSPDGRLRTEADQPAPVSEYGRSKRAAELAAEQFAAEVPITVVRPSIVFGPGDHTTLPLFRPVSRFGVQVSAGLTQFRYSLIHVTDLARLLILAAQRGKRLAPPQPGDRAPPHQGYYFAACEQHPTYAELAQTIGSLIGRSHVAVIPIATPLIWLIADSAEVVAHLLRRPLILNHDKAREMTAGAWACSPDVAAAELGFRTGAPLRQRLQETLQWYRGQHWL